MKALIKELKDKIIGELHLEGLDPDQIPDDTPFFDGGLCLDSVDLLVIVAVLDRDYGVEIFSRELGEKVFVTLSTLAVYVTENRKKF